MRPLVEQGRQAIARQPRLQRRQVALQVEDDVEVAFRVDLVDGLEDAIGARGMILRVITASPPAAAMASMIS